MGQFPLGQEIEVEKLYQLLTAENLIIPPEVLSSTSATRKTIHKDILDKLVLKSLVLDVSATRMSKSCRLHHQIRDFCIFQGLNEEFFEIVNFKSIPGKFGGTTRRLAVYSSKNKIKFNIDKDMAEKIRSLLIFGICASERCNTDWTPELDHKLKEFINLRVLDFNGINFGSLWRFPIKAMDKRLRLKYLGFRGCNLHSLPSYIRKLQALETLDLRTDCELTIPDVLHTLKRLRHLYFPIFYKSKDDKSKLQLNGLENLEILVNLDTSVCSVEGLSKLNNIVILTTHSYGNFKDLKDVIKCLNENRDNMQKSSVTIENFDTHTKERATIFKNLLECESLHYLNIEGYIGQLLEDVNMSSSLTEIVFHDSELKDDHTINELGKLQNLQSLDLSSDAYVGKEMKFSKASGFSNLKILKLRNLRFLEELTIEEGAMPNLSTLVIEYCGKLRKRVMPEALRTIIQEVELHSEDWEDEEDWKECFSYSIL